MNKTNSLHLPKSALQKWSCLMVFFLGLNYSMAQVPQSERDALIALYNATDGPNWRFNNNWLSEDVSTWHGVTVRDGHVTGLSFQYSFLNGSIPPEFWDLSYIDNLSIKEPYLTFYFPDIIQLTDLVDLTIYDVTLTGQIPPEINLLNKLSRLNLKSNQLTGAIPVEICTMNNLEDITIVNNPLNGGIPPEFGNMSNLWALNLSDCNLSGTIPPELGNMNSLAFLNLNRNNLSGSIPPELGNINTLNNLYLGGNDLSGSIPPELGDYPYLYNLELEQNQLTGSIPPELGNLLVLSSLKLFNNQLSGTLPPELGNCTLLDGLWLNDNQLSGSVPATFQNLVNLRFFNINNNQLTGLPDITGLTQIIDLHVENNKLTFEDLESNSELTCGTYFSFSPQADVPVSQSVIEVEEGGSFSMSVNVGGDNNEYRWYRDGQSVGGQPVFSNTYATAWDVGTYICYIVNFQVCDLVLESEEVIVKVLKGGVPVDEYNALVALYNSTDGPNWTNNTNWLSGDVSTWHGVEVTNGHVTGIELWSNHISGVIPSDIQNLDQLQYFRIPYNYLDAPLPDEFYSLSNLMELDVKMCFMGGEISPLLGNLTQLRELNMELNDLTGEIPSSIDALTNLEVFKLDTNQLSGNIPAGLWQLTNLRELTLSVNQVGGTIPPEIGNLTNLEIFNVAINDFEGDIPPELGDLTNLNQLIVSGNSFTGTIPPEIGNLVNLTSLILGANYFTGEVPVEISNLSSLEYLYINSNQFSDLPDLSVLQNTNIFAQLNNFTFEDLEPNINPGYFIYSPQKTVPADDDEIIIEEGQSLSLTIAVGGTSNQYQWFKDNVAVSSLSGSPDYEVASYSDALHEGEYICHITSSLVPGLTLVSAPINVITGLGGVPAEEYNALVALYNSTNGNNWHFNTNWLEGNVEDWYGVTVTEGHVESIDLHGNGLTGNIPGEIGDLPFLKQLVLHSNLLNGTIPIEITNLQSLETLELWFNDISGTIPKEIGGMSTLQILNLSNNELTGQIPEEIGDLNNLASLKLSFNQLSGHLPPELGNLSQLQDLSLGSNQFYGQLPSELGNLLQLEILILSANQFTGSLPPELNNLSQLMMFYIGGNNFSGEISPGIGNLVNLKFMQFSNNLFSGSLPPEIGNLVNLKVLDLSSNQFSGSLPEEIGILINLEQLSLNYNNFTGSVPQSFENLVNLIFLYLDYNQISGLPDLSNINFPNTIDDGMGNGFDHVLAVKNNSLQFDDIERNTANLPFSNFYSPQAKIIMNPNEYFILVGLPLTLTVSVRGSNNQYQWFKDGTAVSTVSTNPEFTIASTIKDDSGIYTCQVTNTVVTGLTLTTEDIEVLIHDPLITQTIPLSANWNIFSTYVEPLDNSCSAVIGDAGLTSSMSIVKNEAGAAYFPSLNFGGFTTFDVGEGYQSKMISGEDFEITGVPIEPEDVTLTLQSGWNMLGYLRQSAGALTDMLDPVLGSIEIIKDESGLAYYPSLGFGLLNTLEPGEGYMVKMVSQASFSYPSNGAKSGITKPNYVEGPQYFGTPQNTGSNMTLIIPEKAWDVLPEHGDEIAVFAPDGRLVGSAVLKNAHNMLPVFGDDLTSETKDGLSDGEAFTLQLWHKSSGEIQTLEITNWQDWAPGQQIYQHNGVAVVGKIKSGSSVTGIDAESAKMSFSLYPNPVKDELKIHFNTKRHSNCSISIFNSIGQCLKNISGISSAQQTVSVDTQALKAGVYVVRVQSTEGTENITFIKSGN